MDLEKWDSGGYPIPFMARVIAWYQLHILTELHRNDAVATKAEQDAKRKRK